MHRAGDPAFPDAEFIISRVKWNGTNPGICHPVVFHTVQIRTGRRKFAQMGRVRDFSPANGGYTSPVFRIRIAEDGDV